MNEEVRKQLEELAGNYAEATHGFRPHKYTEAAFMAGAQAAWDLATKQMKPLIIAHDELFPNPKHISLADVSFIRNCSKATQPSEDSQVAPETKRQVGVTGGERPAHTEDDERDAKAFGDDLAKPILRSMYPSLSRTEMSNFLAAAFLAGRRGLREAVQAALQKEWKEMHIWKPTLHFCANWDFLLIDKSDGEFEFCTCFNPPKEDA